MPKNSSDGKVRDDVPVGVMFQFFTEVGIINQLASTVFLNRLPDGFTVLQFSVLNHLIRVADGRTPIQIASAFQVPKTSMTHTLSGLQEHGLVIFKPNPKDGRSKCVWLTDAGQQFRNEAIASLAIDIARFAPQINIEDIVHVIPVLQQVRQVLDKDRD